MKPDNIYLIRHGESEGNVNKSIYKEKPDYAYRLTERGVWQADEAGLILKELTQQKLVKFYYSPFWRARDTFLTIAEHCSVHSAFEDVRLREQEWGTSFESKDEDIENKRDTYGHFYYRIKNGESCADVYDRVSDFLNTLQRDFQKDDYPSECALVMHGMTMRVFIMRWFHMTVEEFEMLANPKNCGIFHLKLNDKGRYDLVTELKRYEKYNHDFQYPEMNLLNQYKL